MLPQRAHGGIKKSFNDSGYKPSQEMIIFRRITEANSKHGLLQTFGTLAFQKNAP